MVGEETLRDIGLLVEVHDEAALAAFLANRRDQPAEVRLADAALEVERRDDAGGTVSRSRHGWEVASAAAQDESRTYLLVAVVFPFGQDPFLMLRGSRHFDLLAAGVRLAEGRLAMAMQ